MAERRLILAMQPGTVWNGNGDTATNMTTVTPAPRNTADLQFPIPGIIGWGSHSSLQFEWTVTALSGTGTPSIQFFIETLGGDGVYYPIYSGTAISATGSGSTSIGPGLAVAQNIGVQGRIRWVIAGTGGPTATGSLSLIGQ